MQIQVSIPGSLSAKNKSETESSSSRVTLVVKLFRFLTVHWAFMLAICFWEAIFSYKSYHLSDCYQLYVSCKNNIGKALNYQTIKCTHSVPSYIQCTYSRYFIWLAQNCEKVAYSHGNGIKLISPMEVIKKCEPLLANMHFSATLPWEWLQRVHSDCMECAHLRI